MSKYINADKFISYIDAGHYRNPCERVFSENDVVDMIKKFKGEDIVFCKNCKFWEYKCQGDFDFTYGNCLYWSIKEYREWYPETTGKCYCSNGEERKETE